MSCIGGYLTLGKTFEALSWPIPLRLFGGALARGLLARSVFPVSTVILSTSPSFWAPLAS
jgi:hypothetical protein